MEWGNPSLKSFTTVWPDVVVHTCNPSYSKGRDRRMESSRPAQAKI
jgi:hypothetical protein